MSFVVPLRALVSAIAALAMLVCASAALHAAPFEIEIVVADNLVDQGQYASLELDSHDNPHIAYHDLTNQEIKYAYKVGANWIVETVDSGNLIGAYASLALDPNDVPHVVYYNGEAGLLRYAERSTGSWIAETVPDTGIYGSWCSIAVGSDGVPVVAYRHDSDDALAVKKKDGVWLSLGGSGNPGDGFHTDTTIGPNNLPIVSHYTNTGLAFWRKGETFTVIQTIEGGGDLGKYNSIAAAPDGTMHISYHDEINGFLKYASNTVAPSQWQTEIVDDGGFVEDVGEWSSIALDGFGEPHITYYNATNGDMRYAFRINATWTIQKVDQSHDNHGEYSSLKLDSQGNPHVAYYNSDEDGLQYAGGGIRLISPVGGETWAVGSLQNVQWFGTGEVDIYLSSNGVADSDLTLANDVYRSPVQIRVPHVPTRFARVKVRRGGYFSTSESDSFFTVDASIIVSNLKGTLVGNDVVLSWKTTPGPEAGIGYMVRRTEQGKPPVVLHPGLLRESQYRDEDAPAGTSYRVSAVNGLGGETILGDVQALPEIAAGRLLHISPNPMRGGDALVQFRAFPGTQVQLQVFDVRGTLVRSLYSGQAASEIGWTRWDGTDARGVNTNSGVYFVRLTSPAGLQSTQRIILVR
jgi:hypothetical protein